MKRIEVDVDEDRCVGAGECERIAPHTFEIGPDGVSTVIRAREQDMSVILEAASHCPMKAIAVRQDGKPPPSVRTPTSRPERLTEPK